jgi:hypothetical protein
MDYTNYQNDPKVYTRKKGREIGLKIQKSLYITLLFLVFIHAPKILDKLFSIITLREFELVTDLGVPTIKGYIYTGILFFCAVLGVLWN